jgi:4-diphosphocytidyl-2-C-methyl-D-erythritol kinase
LSQARRLRARAPAKVNLTLEVGARRPDGYHEVESTLLALDRCDELAAELQEGPCEVRFHLHGEAWTPDVPADETNLAVRAARAVLELARQRGLPPCTLDLTLVKRLPSRAGLGGGSADAAATLALGARLLGIADHDPALLEACTGLGADCAFFLAARETGIAYTSGRGERVETLRAPTRALWVAVLVPAVGCSTEAVYRALDAAELQRKSGGRARLAELDLPSLAELRALLFNRLEEAALAVEPELARVRELCDDADSAHFRMAGSGSSFFGLFDERRDAEAALARLTALGKARDLALRDAFVAAPLARGLELFEGK